MASYRAAAPEQTRVIPLDELTLVYHRPAGATHLLADAAVEILLAIQDGDRDLPVLRERFGLAEREIPALEERLQELVDAGLVEVT